MANPDDPDLLGKARLDRDWHAESIRCWDQVRASDCEHAPAMVVSGTGLARLAEQAPALARESDPWFIIYGQHPESFGRAAPALFAYLRKCGWKILYYAFDEASRTMPCFRAIAPHLDVLIHDEDPIDAAGEAALGPGCRRIPHSWVANRIPFESAFNENPESKIVFLGSQMGLTPNRRSQIEALRNVFKDRFVCLTDHSLSIADRNSLSRYKVSVCPEGRKFSTPAMSRSHTDRPFWSGCLGLVPVCENSDSGDRLDALAANSVILRYSHGSVKDLLAACEAALAAPTEQRRRIFEFFNHSGTVVTQVARQIAAFRALPPSGPAPTSAPQPPGATRAG